MSSWWLIPILGAGVISFLFSWYFQSAGRRMGFVDVPNKPRKEHVGAIPTLGGLAIYLAFSSVILGLLFATDHLTSGAITQTQLLAWLLGGGVLILGGLADDRFDLRARHAILFPILASVVAIAGGMGVSKLTNPLGGFFEIGDLISHLITFVWLMGVMYTTKLLDGLDGLASGVTVIGMVMIALLALSVKFFQPDVALLSLVAASATLGFLVWNFAPAKIYLGEGGSTLMGYLVGGLAVISGSKVATALLVVGVPALDIVFVLADRWRGKRPLFAGDRAHLHHRLRDYGFSPRAAAIFYYVVAFSFGITTLIFSSWQKVIALGALSCFAVLVVLFLSSRKKV